MIASIPPPPYDAAMARKKESLLLGKLLKKIAPKLGAKVMIEPDWGIVGQITFKSGKRSYFRYNTLDLNPVGASDVAKDKGYATYFISKMGYSAVPGRTFYSDRWAEQIGSTERIDSAYRYAKRIGFPVFVKPNSGSQGSGVAMVHNKVEFYRAMREIFIDDRVAIVQKPVTGRDYRIVVLDDEVISAYERIPLSVVGDGRSNIAQLLKRKQRLFDTEGRDTRLKLDDPRIAAKLKSVRLSLKSVPKKDERIALLDNANLSSGGDSEDVTEFVHPDFKKLAIRLTRDMGLRLCGVDLIVDGSILEKPARYWVLEINAAPGLDHYAKGGRAQERIVENLYTKVLKSLAR